MKIKSTFHLGAMDKDSNTALIENGKTRHVENIRFHTNEGDDGVGVNIKGTLQISDATDGNNDLKCVGAIFNADKDVIYYALASTNGVISKIVEYDIVNDNTTIILDDSNSVLKFNKNDFITGWDEIDGIQIWSEWGNNVRRINTERAKLYGLNGFTEDDITLIVKPPIQKLAITLQKTATILKEENNIEEDMFAFSYRWKYLDGEYSTLAPFTEYAFEPKDYDYDLSAQSLRSMINAFNEVKIDFNTGNERVTEIQLVFIKSNSLSLNVIDDFNKTKLGYADNTTQTFLFNNSKVYRVLSENILRNYFHNVPLTNRAQLLIEGRLLLANYREQFDIKDNLGVEIEIDYNLEIQSLANTQDINIPDGEGGIILVTVGTGIPKKTVKSYRDYEVGLIYLENFGRQTTILNSKTNTIFLESILAAKENSILVNLTHKPPAFATHYRFFIRQAKKNYDSIIPVLFYEDGTYRWIKLEGADKDKVKEGDYLIVKNDSSGILNTLIKTKVLEVTQQEKNFLQNEDVIDEIVEKSGLYFKIKPDGFRLSKDDFENFAIDTFDSTRRKYNNPVRALTVYTDGPEMYYYGDTLNDCSVFGSSIISTNPRRYLIEIDSLGATDTFRWSNDNGASFLGSNIPITPGIVQNLNTGAGTDGLNIVFENQTGHSLLDNWIANTRPVWNVQGDSRAYAFFRTSGDYREQLELVTWSSGTFEIGKLYEIATLGTTDFTLIGATANTVGFTFFATGPGIGSGTATRYSYDDEIIENGAVITLKYDEYGRGNTFWEINSTSSAKYDNIQEWFYKENILADIISQVPAFNAADIHFVRGILYHDDNATQITQDNLGFMTMVIKSQEHGTTTSRVKLRADTTLFQTDGLSFLLFETEPKEQPIDIYHEIGKTYDITNGFHIGDASVGDINQDAVTDLKIKLDFFNAFSYGNSLESYKIKDEFNAKGLAVGVRTLTNLANEYKQIDRISDITWSGIYEDDFNINNLNDFNQVLSNFIKLNKEKGSIQKLHNSNGNLMVFQEDAIGIVLYNKNIIYSADGGSTVRVSTNILEKQSYRLYGGGIYGTKNPEGFAVRGNRVYIPDESRGAILRLANDGVTELNEIYGLEHHITDEMINNKGLFKVGGYDPKTGEYVLNLPNTVGTLAFKEKSKGFPNYFTYHSDFMLGADNVFYSWKNGIMYKHDASATYNNFYGVQYSSKIKFYVNIGFSIEKVFNALGLESTHAWLVNLATKLTSRQIPKDSFEKIEDYWFSEIMGNTNGDTLTSPNFGLGSYAIVNGEIITTVIPNSLCVSDIIADSALLDIEVVKEIHPNKIVLNTAVNKAIGFLVYKKNSNIDGEAIRGDVLEVEMINDEITKTELRAVNIEYTKSENS